MRVSRDIKKVGLLVRKDEIFALAFLVNRRKIRTRSRRLEFVRASDQTPSQVKYRLREMWLSALPETNAKQSRKFIDLTRTSVSRI